MNGLDALLNRMVGLLGPDGKGEALIAGFMRLPLRDKLALMVKFGRGLWVARKFDTRGLIEAGPGIRIIKRNGEIHMTRLCRLQENVHIAVVGKRQKAVLRLGYDVGIAARTRINVGLSVSIGSGCRIGWDCDIMDGSFHRILWLDRPPNPVFEPVVIEDKVWIGSRTIVLQGVTIGANSVIGAGSVVTKDIPPNVFAAGCPARVICEIAGWDPRAYPEDEPKAISR